MVPSKTGYSMNAAIQTAVNGFLALSVWTVRNYPLKSFHQELPVYNIYFVHPPNE